MIVEILPAYDKDADTYGKHAETATRTAGLDGVAFGRRIRYPWRLFINPDAVPGRRGANVGHPAGVYFERRGVVYHEGHLDGYGHVRACLRFGEKSLPRLRSAKKLTSLN
jgi:hypothetical protein